MHRVYDVAQISLASLAGRSHRFSACPLLRVSRSATNQQYGALHVVAVVTVRWLHIARIQVRTAAAPRQAASHAAKRTGVGGWVERVRERFRVERLYDERGT